MWLVLAVTLYRLLAHAGRNIARAMVVFVAVSAAITCLNMVHQLGALLVATNSSYSPPSAPTAPTPWFSS